MSVDVVMPKVGESITSGVIAAWLLHRRAPRPTTTYGR